MVIPFFSEIRKGPKKIFAPPSKKLCSLTFNNSDSPMEEILRKETAKTDANLLIVTLEKKEEKTAIMNGPGRAHEKEENVQAIKPVKKSRKVGKTLTSRYPAEKQAKEKEKVKPNLTSEEFEEIVKIVLQNSCPKNLGQPLTWVQCSLSNCKKWRKLHRNIDPTVLPENWSCDQNTDLQYNCCDIPEETWTEVDSEVVYASYIPGSIIWAKQYGYPWWPGMIEPDPDLGQYFLFLSPHDSMPSKYHVTFFGETVTRAWIPVNMLKNFQELSWELSGVKKYKNKDFAPKLNSALTMAQEAEKVGIQERVNTFGFWSRYSRSDSGEEKDVMPSGNNSLTSSLENEEKNQRKRRDRKNF
ncbi:zinc finger CW-type PWWP domain protein 1 [Suncus etruscus]|uniref:zinc finger CW-type PWWP domain protein 1 n=1 Tax=Suncus etruscus TaxID=109475 RepID=UPI00210F865A|nr:zinc finger CW-type PWWP domain protein 1 [Suncus etruscus]